MASGIITLSSTRNVLEGRIVWSSASNGVAANSSQVTADLQVRRTDGYTNIGNWSGSLQIGSTTESFTTHASVAGSWVSLKSFTVPSISHNSDGTGSCYIYGIGNGPSGTSMAGHYVSGDGTAILDTIPRASSITATDANIGSASAININAASTSFTHSVAYSFGSLSGYILANGSTTSTETKISATSIGWTVPTTFFQQIPTVQSGTVTITCKTYSGNTLVGTKTTTMTAYVPTSGTYDSFPVIDTKTVVDTNQATINLTGDSSRLVLYKSNAKIDVVCRCINYGTFNKLNSGGVGGTAMTTSTSSSNGTTTITGTITINASDKTYYSVYLSDKRGLWILETMDVAHGDFTLVPYIPLTMSVDIKRVSATSSSAYLSFSGNVYNGYFDANENNFNDLTIKWRYKETNGNWITTGADDTTNGWHNLTKNTDFKYGSGDTYYSGNGNSQSNITISNLFDYQKSYIIEVYYKDSLSEYSISKPLSKGEPVSDEGVDSNGNNYFNVNGTIYQNNKDISKQSTVQMYDANQLYITISTAWSGYKIPLSNATVTGTALSFDSTNKRIVVNENGYVDFIGRLNVYLYDYVNGDYSLILRKNNSTSWQLCYKRMTQTDNYYDFVMGHAYNIAVSEGDYFELHVSCGGTGTLRTFEMLQTSLSATFRR